MANYPRIVDVDRNQPVTIELRTANGNHQNSGLRRNYYSGACDNIALTSNTETKAKWILQVADLKPADWQVGRPPEQRKFVFYSLTTALVSAGGNPTLLRAVVEVIQNGNVLDTTHVRTGLNTNSELTVELTYEFE